MENRKKASRFS